MVADVGHLIGIPYRSGGGDFSGADCWGLCKLAARDVFGKRLPDYIYADASNGIEAGQVIDEGCLTWRRVEPGQERAGDIITLRVTLPWPTHCAIVVEPGLMLHTLAGHDSALESYDTVKWSRRVDGFWRR